MKDTKTLRRGYLRSAERSSAPASYCIEVSINTVMEAWADLAADITLAGMTLEQFQARVKPSLDARNELATARNTRINALTGRMVSDEESQKTLLLVVNAIKGDPTEGEDSALYEARPHFLYGGPGTTSKSPDTIFEICFTSTRHRVPRL